MNIHVESLFVGLMVYWDDVEGAARYYVHLLIEGEYLEDLYQNGSIVIPKGKRVSQEIKFVECDRYTKTYSFFGLAKIDGKNIGHDYQLKDTGLHYYIFVEAEDKNGDIIKKSTKLIGNVLTLRNGYLTNK